MPTAPNRIWPAFRIVRQARPRRMPKRPRPIRWPPTRLMQSTAPMRCAAARNRRPRHRRRQARPIRPIAANSPPPAPDAATPPDNTPAPSAAPDSTPAPGVAPAPSTPRDVRSAAARNSTGRTGEQRRSWRPANGRRRRVAWLQTIERAAARSVDLAIRGLADHRALPGNGCECRGGDRSDRASQWRSGSDGTKRSKGRAVGGPAAMSGAVVANLDVLNNPTSSSVYANAGGGTPQAVVLFPGRWNFRYGSGSLPDSRGGCRIPAARRNRLHQGRGPLLQPHGEHASREAPDGDLRQVSGPRKRGGAEIIHEGVPADKVLVEAVGDSQPVYYESMPKGEEGNRRAEIFVQGLV